MSGAVARPIGSFLYLYLPLAEQDELADQIQNKKDGTKEQEKSVAVPAFRRHLQQFRGRKNNVLQALKRGERGEGGEEEEKDSVPSHSRVSAVANHKS